jgi:MFS family permease
MAGLLGWAFGGFIFGVIADYIGRVRALMFSIIIFSVFTALQGVAQGSGISARTASSPGSAPGRS